MKLPRQLPRHRIAGFTLVEAYMCATIMVLLVLALTACQLFALKIYNLASTKLTATASARKGMNDIRDQIRGASDVQVGTYVPANNTFSLIAQGSQQIGNAVMIYTNNPNNPGVAGNVSTIFFMNQTASNLCSVTCVSSNGNYTVQTSTLVSNIVCFITNYYAFDAEDAFGNIVTNNVNDRVIHVKVQFAMWEYPLAGVVGQNAMYDYYQLQCRACRRIMDY